MEGVQGGSCCRKQQGSRACPLAPIHPLKVGLRGYFACRQLVQHGHTAINITGGWKSYKDFKAAHALQSGAANGATNGAKL